MPRPRVPETPPSVTTETMPRTVRCSGLSAEQRQQLFRGMQRLQPELVALLRDPVVGELRETFGGVLHLSEEEFCQMMAAGAGCSGAGDEEGCAR